MPAQFTKKIICAALAVCMSVAPVLADDQGGEITEPTPSSEVIVVPTEAPVPDPTPVPTVEPTPEPTVEPTPGPTPEPTQAPVDLSEERAVTIAVRWSDDNDRDGLRPTQYSVTLSGSDGGVRTLNSADSSQGAWACFLPIRDFYGNGITYSANSDVTSGYSMSVEGDAASGYIALTFSRQPERKSVMMRIFWDDGGDISRRPSSITANVTSKGTTVGSFSLYAGNEWQDTYTGYAYENGGQPVSISAILTPDSQAALERAGYTVSVQQVTESYYELRCSARPMYVYGNVKVVWKDEDNLDGKRPTVLNIQFKDNTGNAVPYQMTETGGWQLGNIELLGVSAGQELDYRLSIDPVDGYEFLIDKSQKTTFLVTAVHVPEYVTKAINIIWTDSDDVDGLRPKQVKAYLTASNGQKTEVVLSADHGWNQTVKLQKADQMGDIRYSLSVDGVDGYQITSTEEEANRYVITGLHEPKTSDILAVVTWRDSDDIDKLRPNAFSISLIGSDGSKKDAILMKDRGWKYTFEKLPAYANKQKIEYQLRLDVPAQYTHSIQSQNNPASFNIILSHNAEVSNFSITTIWNDEGNKDKLRPESLHMIVTADNATYPADLKASDNYFMMLTIPGTVTNVQGTVSEVNGYTSQVRKNGDKLVVTMTRAIEKVDIPIQIEWGDLDASMRPKSVEVYLRGSDGSSRTCYITARTNWSGVIRNVEHAVNGTSNTFDLAVKELDGFAFVTQEKADGGYIIRGIAIESAGQPSETSQPEVFPDGPGGIATQEKPAKKGMSWGVFLVSVFLIVGTGFGVLMIDPEMRCRVLSVVQRAQDVFLKRGKHD